MVDGHGLLPGLDDGLQRVGELRDHLQLERRLAVVGPEARGGVRHVGVRCPPDHRAAQTLEALLERGEVLDLVGLAVADHHVGLAGEDRGDELADVAAVVLVVGVGVDDHVGVQLQAGVQTGLEGGRQPLVVGQAHHVVDPVRARHLHRAVARAVIDDQPLHDVEARQLAGQVGESGRERLLLVEAGDLHDQLHRGLRSVEAGPAVRPITGPLRVRHPRFTLTVPGGPSVAGRDAEADRRLRRTRGPLAAPALPAQLRPLRLARLGPGDRPRGPGHQRRLLLEAAPGPLHRGLRALLGARRLHTACALDRRWPAPGRCWRWRWPSGSPGASPAAEWPARWAAWWPRPPCS